MYMKLIVKYFLLSDILVLGGQLRFGQNYFPLADKYYLWVVLDNSHLVFR